MTHLQQTGNDQTMKYKAVLFDLGGTLVKTAGIPEIFRRILESFGSRVDIDLIEKAYEANKIRFDVEAGQVELGESFWTKWNANLLIEVGIENDTEHLARRISDAWWNHAGLQLYSDVLPTVTNLSTKKIPTGIVTNALRNDYEQILRRLRIEQYFDIVVGTDDCRAAKPDPRIFEYALEKLNLEPSETIFVGDDVRRDYEGSKKAGMKPLLISRRRKASKDFESVDELTEILHYL
jgi:putative hydrolase of the HAD superfamily